MKKLLIAITYFSILVSSTLQGQSTATIPENSNVAAVDGIANEAIWGTITPNQIDKVFASETIDDANDLSAYWKAYFNDVGIFILVEVTADDSLYTERGNFWENDYVDIYFDMNVGNLDDGLGASSIESGHYNLYYTRDPIVETISDGSWKDGIEVGITVNTSDNTSIHEYYIPWANIPDINYDVFTPNNTDVIGFDVMVIDNDDGTSTRNRMLWSNDGTTDENWNNMDDAGRLSFGATVNPEISMTDDGTITEGSENGEIITITLKDDTFVSTLIPSNWNFYNLPDGVSVGSINRTSSTTVSLTLSGNTTTDYDTEITNFTVTIGASELVTSTEMLSVSNGVVFTPKYKAPVSSYMEFDGEILEGQEDGEVITYYLTSCEFVDTLNINLWWSYNLPSGIVASNMIRINDTTATFTLKGNGSFDYDEDITNFSMKPSRDQIKNNIDVPQPVHSVVFTANKEKTVSMYPVNTLEAMMEDGEQILAVLENDTLVNTITPSNWQLNGLPAGVTVASIEKERESRALITLTGNSSGETPYTLTISVKSSELAGSSSEFTSINSIRVGENHTHNIDVSESHKMDEGVATDYLINHCYETLRLKQGFNGSWGASTYMLANIASDDIIKGGLYYDDLKPYEEIDSLSISTNNSAVLAQWEKNYSGIIHCNKLIEEISEEAPNANRLIAEAKFLRAYYYFNLVRFYGNVPIISSSCYDMYSLPANNTSQEVYAFIKTELAAIIGALPQKSSLADNEKGRVTSGAAQTLLAKVNLYTHSWNDVITNLDAVITSGEYNLLANYDSLWSVTQEHNAESIFEVEYTDTINAQYQSGKAEAGNIDIQFMGVRGLDYDDEDYKAGWGFCKVTPELVNKYAEIDDTIRLQATVLFADSLKSTYDDTYDFTGYYNKKYTTKKRFTPQNSTMWAQNEVIMRYADVLLMYAEASAQLGNTGDALANLNMVRSRAQLPEITGISGPSLIDTIYAERRLELALESNRYFDVLRWGQAEEAFATEAYNPETNGLFPIPSEVILNSMLVKQNDGYVREDMYYTQTSNSVGFANRDFSPEFNKPYFEKKMQIDSVLSYDLSKCESSAKLNAKRLYEYENEQIVGEKHLLLDQIQNKWIVDIDITYLYDENGNLKYAYHEDVSEGNYHLEYFYTYDDDNYIKEVVQWVYPYVSINTTTYNWNSSHTEYRSYSYFGSISNPNAYLNDSTYSLFTNSGDTLIETQQRYYGGPTENRVFKFRKDGSLYEYKAINKIGADTNYFRWDKYNIEETNGRISEYVHHYYNTSEHKFDTVAQNYDGFINGSYRSVVTAELDESCQQLIPWNITRHFARNMDVVCTPDTAIVIDTITMGESSHGYSETGVFYINGTGVSGCDSVTILNLTVMEETQGLVNQNTLLNTKVYPNPSTGYIVVEMPQISEKADIRIISSNGHIYYRNTIQSGSQSTVEIDNLKPGIYHVQIQNNNATYNQRLVVK